MSTLDLLAIRDLSYKKLDKCSTSALRELGHDEQRKLLD